MIRFKSIAEQRLDFAFEKVQEVISMHKISYTDEKEVQTLLYLFPDKLKKNEEFINKLSNHQRLIPSERKNKIAGNKDYDEIQKTYHQYVKSIAMLVLNSGLVAALLFAQGKANKNDNKGIAYALIIQHLTEWLKDQGRVTSSNKGAIKELYVQNSQDIRHATIETVRFLEDLKRVADARLYKPESLDQKSKKNG